MKASMLTAGAVLLAFAVGPAQAACVATPGLTCSYTNSDTRTVYKLVPENDPELTAVRDNDTNEVVGYTGPSAPTTPSSSGD